MTIGREQEAEGRDRWRRLSRPEGEEEGKEEDEGRREGGGGKGGGFKGRGMWRGEKSDKKGWANDFLEERVRRK